MPSTVPPYLLPRPRATVLSGLPKELLIRISRFLSTNSLCSFLLVNREINQLCNLVLETPTPKSGDLQRAIAYHTTHDQEGKLMRVLKNSQQMLMRHHESQFEAMTYACAAGFGNLIQWLIALRVDPDIRSSKPAKDSELKQQSVISPLMAAAQRNDPTFAALCPADRAFLA
jgi:hypothetical protein